MKQLYKLYYREHGVRQSDQLITLRPFQLQAFPQNSLFHAVPSAASGPDVDPAQPYYANYPKRIALENLTEYHEMEGPVRVPSFNMNNLTQAFRQKNKEHWVLQEKPYLTETNPNTLVVENYGYLDTIHKYSPVQMTPYYQWSNKYRTLWNNVNAIAKVSERHQFVLYPIPSLMQGKAVLDRFMDQPASTQMVNIVGISGDAGYMQLDLWRWLNPKTRKYSLLNEIEARNYGRVNLVFQSVLGKQLLVNLGYLNSWIKGQENTTDLTSIVQLAFEALQKVYLKFSMSLNSQEDDDVEGFLTTQITGGVTSVEKSTTPETEQADFVKPAEGATEPSEEPIDDELEEPSAAIAELRQDVASARLQSADTAEKNLLANSAKSSNLLKAALDDIDKDIEALDRVNLSQLKASGKALSANENEPSEETIDVEAIKQKAFDDATPEERLRLKLNQNAESNRITAAEYRKMTQVIEAFNASGDPYGSKLSRKEASVIRPEELLVTPEEAALVTSDSVPDKTMAKASLNIYTKKYLRTTHKKDIMNAVSALQSAGVIVKNHEVEIKHSVLGSSEHHILELRPIDGAPSTIKFTLPIVDEDGTFMAGGSRYILRAQRVDTIIRKIAPRIVGLSTYYGKTFVQTNLKVVNDSLAWLYRQINLAALAQDAYIHDVSPGNVYDHDFKSPYLYGALANEYTQLKVGGATLMFDHEKRESAAGIEVLKSVEKEGRIWCGWSKSKQPIVLTKNNHFVEITGNGDNDLGDVYDFFQVDRAKCPLDFSEIRIFSKYLPVGIVLGYYLGFRGVVALLGVPYRVVEGRKSKNLEKNEYAITFKDESYIFTTDNRVATMILAGFNDYDKALKQFDRKEFDHKAVYLNLLMSKKIGAIYVRELDMMETGFVDPISRELLLKDKEPTTLVGLMIRGTELLTTYDHPASQDRTVMRERGYERFAGAIYKETMQAIRQFRNKNTMGRSKVDMSPYQVWNSIMQDNSMKIVEDINPIQNLKEQEVMTYAGTGGRDKDTMTKPSRAAHVSDFGLISESTVDNTSVGTIAYMSANPNLSDTRGSMRAVKEINPTSVLSTSAMISPGINHDQMKRIMFVTTQHSHTIASSAYRQPAVRTGYEFIVGQRTGKLFSTSAEEDGKVTSLVERGLIVTYASGRQIGIELGRQYGRAEGTTYPHDIISPLKVGESFKKGDILAYNTAFFEPDFLNPKDIILKVNRNALTVLQESASTNEDSAAISPKFGETCQTEVVKVKSYVVRFAQNLAEVQKIGTELKPKDILMIIEDEITSKIGNFSDAAISTLKRLGNVAPKASVIGRLDKIEVFYHGEKRDMSASLKRLADRSDADLAEAAKASGKPVITGRVTEEYRVAGTPLELDTAEVRFYLSIKAGSGVGNKLVFSHQMKCTISEVLQSDMHTEDGREVEAVFGYRSIAARGVLSPAIMGTTNSLLYHISQQAAKLYFGS